MSIDQIDYDEYTRDYGDYTESSIKKFIRMFICLLGRHREDMSVTYKQIDEMELVKGVYIDVARLQRVIVSAFDDIKRCADYHKLFEADDVSKILTISICEHKIAGFFTKWFMTFSPIIVPPDTMKAFERLCDKFEAEPDDERKKNVFQLRKWLNHINEYFIFWVAFVTIMKIPMQYISFLGREERRDLLYLLTFRTGRLQGVDLSLIFHWVQQALSERPSKSVAVANCWERVPAGAEKDEFRKEIADTLAGINRAKDLMLKRGLLKYEIDGETAEQ